MKVLIVGAQGQLGRELQITVPKNIVLSPLSRADLDITNAVAVNEAIKAIKPHCIINASAYNAVDRAETEAPLAFAVNAQGPANLARAANAIAADLIHISTDYVFDGKQCVPYLPQDLPHPLNQYGLSKWQGEKLVLAEHPERSLILRTSWVYSQHAKNFVKNLLDLFQQRDHITMTIDQIGAPTWAKTLATTIWSAIEKKATGIYHWSDEGIASRYDFAIAIQEEARKLNLLNKNCVIKPILSAEFPLPAQRPNYSVLNKSESYKNLDLSAVYWRDNLQKMLLELVNA